MRLRGTDRQSPWPGVELTFRLTRFGISQAPGNVRVARGQKKMPFVKSLSDTEANRRVSSASITP